MDQHDDYDSVGNEKLGLALLIKLFLSGVQVVGGGVAGSLSLVADSLITWVMPVQFWLPSLPGE